MNFIGLALVLALVSPSPGNVLVSPAPDKGEMYPVSRVVSATPGPTVTLSPDWSKAVSQDRAEYARFVRTEASGPVSISASRQVCECQPTEAMRTLQTAFSKIPGVQTTVADMTICNQSAKQFVTTGYAHPDGSGNNVDVYIFRNGPAIYTLTYAFRSARPAPDDVAALAALCPST